MLCYRCREKPSVVKVSIKDSESVRELSQYFCGGCASEILDSHPEIAKELNDARSEGLPPTSIPLRPSGFLMNSEKSFGGVLGHEQEAALDLPKPLC